jgi:glucokinase
MATDMASTAAEGSWFLLADIGGTNARFALLPAKGGDFIEKHVYSVEEYAEFMGALNQFLADVARLGQWQGLPEGACFAVACPVTGDIANFTNSPWSIDKTRVAQALDTNQVEIMNDFAAVGYAVTDLAPADYLSLGSGQVKNGKPIGVLGPGTGLGMASVVCIDGKYHVISGEGGHADFAPVDELEYQILTFLKRQYSRVSVERVMSGKGIANIYHALCEIRGQSHEFNSPAEISAAALAKTSPLAEETLKVFCRILGAAAGNLALTIGAEGGVYIAGGIPPKILDIISHSELRDRFDQKGRYEAYLKEIPLRVVTKNEPGLSGAARRVRQTLY